jgi:hypothetical protein
MPTINGETIVFGFDSNDAPSGITGFFCRSADIKDEPEVIEFATDGFGQVEAAAASNLATRMTTASFTGYIDKDTFDAKTTAESGQITYKAKTYFVKKVSEPIQKGKFTEVTIETERLPLIAN